MFWPCETRTSICRNLATISSGLYRFLAITVLLDVKDIPQVGPLQWGWISIELNRGIMNALANINEEDERIKGTLEGLVPSAALSYRQAIIDLADDTRISFRGPALELREALRETLDHLAPDAAITSADWYVQEKGRTGPIMKQKVRFILKARGQSKSSSTVPEQTTTTVDEMVGTLTRSVYDRSSIATHVGSERKTVI